MGFLLSYRNIKRLCTIDIPRHWGITFHGKAKIRPHVSGFFLRIGLPSTRKRWNGHQKRNFWKTVSKVERLEKVFPFSCGRGSFWKQIKKVGRTPTFLYLDLYFNTAYKWHTAWLTIILFLLLCSCLSVAKKCSVFEKEIITWPYLAHAHAQEKLNIARSTVSCLLVCDNCRYFPSQHASLRLLTFIMRCLQHATSLITVPHCQHAHRHNASTLEVHQADKHYTLRQGRHMTWDIKLYNLSTVFYWSVSLSI